MSFHWLGSHEGYFEVDHRLSPGTLAVPEGKRLEMATLRCEHCHRIVLLNPERKRTRRHCRGCDGYVCDFCPDPIVNDCTSLDAQFDRLQEDAAKRLNISEV